MWPEHLVTTVLFSAILVSEYHTEFTLGYVVKSIGVGISRFPVLFQ